jgi:hypothetical protein
MAILQAPPSRYRIEERGRTLVVVDTQNGNTSLTGPLRAAETGKRAGPWGPAMRDNKDGDFLLRYAGVFTQGKLDNKGRIVLKTAKSYDKSAPRLIALEPPVARQFALLRVAQLSAAAVIIFVWFAFSYIAAIILGVVGFQFNKVMSAAIMRAIVAKSTPAVMG